MERLIAKNTWIAKNTFPVAELFSSPQETQPRTMCTTARQFHWDQVYKTKPENEVSWFEPSPNTSLQLIKRAEFPKSAPIIDIGGGLSRLADRLSAEGYIDVTVLDISSEAISRLLARQGENAPVKGIVADITAWKPDRRYDIWHDRAVLHFLTDDTDRAAYRSVLLEALAPGGQAIIATFAKSGPEKCSGLPVRRYDANELAEFLGNGFRIVENFEMDHRTPAGGTQRFCVTRFIRSGD